MNGYLVVLVHTMDDLPIGFYLWEEEARHKARRVKPMPTTRIRQVYGVDCSTPLSVKMVQFRNGKPISVELVKEFNSEDWG